MPQIGATCAATQEVTAGRSFVGVEVAGLRLRHPNGVVDLSSTVAVAS